MSINETRKVKVVVADPSGLGLFGLAMVTLVASTQKLGWTTGLSFVIPWALFLGAYAQLVAANYDFKHNNIFGATVFGAYSLFWFSIAGCWLISMGVFGEVLKAGADVHQLGVAFIGYLIFSLAMTVGSLETNKVLLLDFIFIDLLFILLAADSFGVHWAHHLAGWAELIISIISFYGAAAAVLNSHFGKAFLPVGKPCGIFK